MTDRIEEQLMRRNERAEGHLQDALRKCINHHVYEYPLLTEMQVVGSLFTVLLNYHLAGYEDVVRETILEAMGALEEDDEEEEDEEED